MWPLILWEMDEKHPSNLLRLHRCAYVPTAREGIRCAKISSLLGLVYMYQRSLTSRPRTCLPVCSLQRYDKSFSLCGAPNSISLHDVCCLFPHCLCLVNCHCLYSLLLFMLSLLVAQNLLARKTNKALD